ncbi:DUF1542 domain-containing protein [Streptococcus suis]|uniref:DUF1542 domain-containing protein n=2 Tax=Streptococcus suis TaxID=1307 RepID=UPI001C97C8F6|nr:DUF1542 domain-containing protein [Streptococcus suis]MBY4981866.1 DUF1542 domain-containing protein [Streptococcus suis]MBY4992612.1 DUF1542 domain-containing protein [Streptococcus suis]MBY5008019.1 DUF1542 domain-containing protein [Streptococcus suis]
MSSKDMFRKEQRFSFRKFSFGLASAVIANVIFGGAIANTPVVHANTTTETAAVATSERIASIPYTVNIVDQAGKVVETKEKKVLVYTVETIATATEYLTADLVPEGYAIVSGLGEVTLTEKADNIFTVKVDKIAPEAVATTTTAESATSETSTAAATPEPASLTATQPTPVTSEVAEAEVAPTTSEESAKPTERTVYLSYITHYVNEANETVDRTGHLVAVTTTDDTAKTQVTVSASENMPSGYELAQDKAKVVVQLVENQTNILVFAVTKKSKEEEIAASQLSNKDVLEQVLSEGVLLSNDAARLLETSQAGNTGLEVATNNTKAVLKEAIQVFDEPTSTQEQVDAQTELVRAASKTLADELLKFDEDGVLTAMLDATTQAITITTSSKGAVRPDYPNHIRDFANSGQGYNGQDFFFGLIDRELTEQASQISATAQAADGSNPSISLLEGRGGQPLSPDKSFGLQINNSGVIYGTTTIKEPGNTVSWQFQAQNGSDTARKQFTFVPYTVVKTDNEPIRRTVQNGVTADDILAKVKSDVTRGDGSTQGPLNATFEQHFNSELTARATGTSTKVAEDAKNGKQIWHEIVGEIPTTAGEHTVTVRSTNVHGQTIDNTVKVILIETPTVTANTDGTVTVTPSQTDGVTKTVDVTYTDEAGVEKKVIATKGQDGNWTVPAGSEVTVDSSTGAVTIPANSVKNGSTVKAVAKDSAGSPSTAATAEALNPPTTVQDKQTIYVFNNTPIATVRAGSDEADNVNKVKVVTLQDPDGIKSVAVGDGGLGDEYKVDAEGYASGTPFVSALGKHGRSFAVTDNQNQVTNVLTATDDKQVTYVMDASATGEITKAAGESATADEILAKVTVDPGNERAHIEGTADRNPKYRKVLAPGQQVPTTPGTHTVTVRVITDSNVYKDVPVTVVIPKYSDTLTATATENTSLIPGSGTAVSQPIAITKAADGSTTTAPAGTTYEIDPAFKAEKEALGYEISVSPTGEVSVKAPAGQEADITVPVTVTYPDKTKDPVSVPFKVDQKGLAQLKATEALDKEATAAKKAIDNNPNLSEAEKQAAKDAVDADTEKAKQAVADATTIDEVDAAKEAGTTNVDGKLLDAAKLDAKNKIDKDVEAANAAIEAKRDADIAEINNTPGLTDDQKKAARDAVTDTAGDALKALDKAADDAKKAIDAETTVAGINNAKTDGEKALDDATAAGEAAIDLTKDKELAKADVDNQAKAAIEAVKNNPNLDATEQAPYIEAIEKAAEEQKAAIDKAKDTAGITDAVNAAEKVNEEQKLAAAKEDAKDKIAEEAAAAKEAIDNNPNLSGAEKTAAKDAVDTEVAKANDAIDKATTPETVQAAEDNGVKAIDAEELVAAKQDAKNKIAEDVKAAKDAIDKDPNLSEDEKKGFKDAVDTEAAKAVADIEKATTPAEAQTAEEAGTAAIAEDVLDAAKQDAKNKIAKDVEAANAAIESNPNLSEDEKKGFKDAVGAEAAKAVADIEKATTPEAAQAAEEAGTAAIAEDVLDAAKQDAKNKIAKDLATVEAAIDANSNLSEDEKKAAKLEAQAKEAEAVANIEKATTPEAVQTLEDAAVKDLANIEIKAAYDDAVKAIEAADNLSTAAKTQALEDLKKARQAAEDAIKTATTADEVAKGALDGLKSIAKVEATAAADDAKAAIAQNSNLTDAEKKVYTDAIDKALKDTETKIDAATDADTVDAETVLAQKDIAKQEVAAATADAVKGIEANTNLTDAEKDEYKATVTKAAETAEKAIADATTAADIQSKTFDATQDVAKEEVKADAADAIAGIKANDNLSDTAKEEAIAAIEEARDTTLENIENAKTAAEVDTATLDAEKANAKAEIKAAADDAKKAIDENANLPASDKNALKLAIDAEVAATNLEIDNAKTAEEIDAATLATEKSIAKAEVKAAAEDALQAIDENANLTDDEKAKAKADVYVELSKAEKAIDKATTADAIDNATLVGEKAFATAELEAAADDAKKAIDANTHLTDDQKQAAKDAVDAELAKAKEAVVAAKTADEVDAATLVGEKAIAKEEIKAVAEDAKKAIDANSNLTDDEKAAAKAAVDTEVAKANEAIDKAATADAVDTATLVGEKAVAKEELKAAADDAKKAIDENANLTPEEKAAAKKAVDAEVAKANDAIDKAATADAVDTATLAGEKAVAKEEVKAAAEDAKKAIDANANLPESEKTALKLAIDAEVAATNLEIDNAKTAEEIDAATLVGEKAVAKEEVKAAAEDALRAIDENANLTDDEKAAAKADVYVELSKAEKAIDKATTADAIDNATLVGEKAFAKEELEAAADDAKKAIDANDNLTPEEKATAKAAVDAEVAKANDAIDAATKADEVDAATLAGEKAVAKEELKAAAEDAKAAIDANDNLTDAEKAAAKDAVDAEVAKANEAIDAATKADEVDAATLAGEKAVAKEELKAAVEDAKKAIDANDNLTDAEKAAAKDAVDAEVAKANEAIDAATKADEVDAATLAGEKAVAKEELKAAADDAKAAIDANDNLTDAEKQAAKDAVDAEVAKANEAIDAATKADEVDAATLVGEKAFATAELEAAADDAKKAIDANDNLTDAEKAAAKKAVDDEAAKAEEAIDAATKADEVDAATLAGEKAVAKEELKAAAEDAKKAIDAAKQGAKNKLMEEADKAKAAIDANPNLTPEEKAAAKAEIDKAVEEAIIAINGAGTHHALGEIKLPLSALIKPVVTVTPVLDPNNLTEEEIARIKALLEENNTFPEGTEIIVSKDASVSIKYPDGSIDLILPAEIVKQADTTAPAITDDAKGNIVVAPTKEAVEFVVTYVDNNGKAQLVIVTKGADGKWTTTDKVVIVDPITGQVIIPGSAIKPGTVVTAYSKDMAGNVSDLNSAEVEAVDANNPAAGVKVKSVTSTSNANKSTKKAKQLPNTGEKATSATSLGLAVLGMGLALFAAKRKKDEEEA